MTASTGRPRDPGVDERVAAAAVALFADVGWTGFSVEGVARRAGVGKASIYLRWPTKEALLDAAFTVHTPPITDIDTGAVRGDLVELARQLLRLYLGDSGRAAMRLALDGQLVPEIQERNAQITSSAVLSARAVVRRGIARGELPATTSVTLLLDTLCGGAIMHALSAPAGLRDAVASGADAYAEQLVTFILGSVLS